MHRYPLAPDGVFRTVQGEGTYHRGRLMVFVRLAGCSVGCEHCDTDYRVARRATATDIVREACEVAKGVRWVWLTGGEPTDLPLVPLLRELRRGGFYIAMATSGVRPVRRGSHWGGIDYLSVSPHDPGKWVQRAGDVLNLVPGLNGFSLKDFQYAADECESGFTDCVVTPCEGKPETLQECLQWIDSRPNWRLGHQDHKAWGVK